MSNKFEISFKTILYTALLIAGAWFIFQLKEVFLGLFISLILMSCLNPTIKTLERHKFPRWLAILSIYLVIITLLGFALGGIVPALIEQTTTLIERLPSFFNQFQFLGIDQQVVSSQLSNFTSIPANIVKFLFGIFSNIVAVIALGVITFYLLLERKNLDTHLSSLFGKEKEMEIEKVIDAIELKLGGWVRGELLLMLIVGVLNYIGFLIIGVNFALPLALLAFLFEIVPNIGPTIAAVPAILVALTISPIHALVTVGWCFLVQQIENSFLVPRIMKKVAGVNPLISILSLAVGLEIAGVGGAILAIPTFITLRVIFLAIKDKRNK
jgi:predicted PurR-regulated permease PerM